VFEFLLINHPLDCPVCDKGGECPLQDYSYAFGPDNSRMEFTRRTFDGDGVKADVDFGPTLMLNRNRCILCTRCVRFMKEIDTDAQIGIVDRGNRSQISTFQDRGVHSLISGNLMDVCPVGAITTRDYRFKSRPWDNPIAVDTTCTLCSKGCSTTAWLKAKPEWAKGSKLIRFTPRLNPDVNGYWMCDIGRFQYHWVESDARLIHSSVRQASGATAAATLPGAIDRGAAHLRPIIEANASAFRMLVSAHGSHEEMFLVREIAQALQGPAGIARVDVTWRTARSRSRWRRSSRCRRWTRPTWPALARRDSMSRRVMCRSPISLRCARRSRPGRSRRSNILDPGPDGSNGDLAWIVEARKAGTLPFLIVQGPVTTALTAAADIVLAGAAWTEKDASYTNDAGILQATSRVMTTPGEAGEDWKILAMLAQALGVAASYADAGAVRAAIAVALPGAPELAGITGLAFAKPLPARTWLNSSNPSERWKWDHLFQDLPPVKGSPVAVRADLIKK